MNGIFDAFNATVNEFFSHPVFKNIKEKNTKKKTTRRKTNYKEKDCKVTFDQSWLFKMNMPGEYITYEEIN